jgi:ABC-type lipopolysaccharide export system ATPase subunit
VTTALFAGTGEARALMIDPELILMDEPSEGLAPVMVQHLEAIIANLGKIGLGILLVEQNLYNALAVADRIYVLETGKVVHEASTESIRQDHSPLMRYLGLHQGCGSLADAMTKATPGRASTGPDRVRRPMATG